MQLKIICGRTGGPEQASIYRQTTKSRLGMICHHKPVQDTQQGAQEALLELPDTSLGSVTVDLQRPNIAPHATPGGASHTSHNGLSGADCCMH